MKDLEKIKSEDLAAQVQDANPANFAIEQEVAQLVGATVPQPTEPSADDARELGAQLLVFLRRALLPIRSALRTAVAAIYAHLDSRCTDYTPAAYDPFRLPAGPYDPMRPFVPRTLPNLLTALTAFDSRKISNGSAPSDGIPDGISLAHLLLDPASVTEIADDNKGWVCRMALSTLWSIFPNLNHNKLVLHFGSMPAGVSRTLNADAEELEFPDIVEFGATSSYPGQTYDIAFNNSRVRKIKIVGMRRWERGVDGAMGAKCTNLEEIDASSIEYINYSYWHYTRNENSFYGATNLRKVKFGAPKGTFKILDHTDDGYGCTKWVDLEFGAGTATNLDIRGWNPTYSLENELTTFLQNFRDHIALRLTANGSGKTLTLSQAVRDAIHAAEATYGIEAIIVTQKGWTLSPAPGASSQ